MSDTQSEIVVSITEAALRLGVTPDGIRKRIRRGQLQTRRVNHARGIHVVLPMESSALVSAGQEGSQNGRSIEAVAQELQATVAHLGASLERLEADTVGMLRETVTVLKEQLATKDQQLAEKDRQLLELHGRVSDLSKTVATLESKKPQGLVPRLRAWLLGPDGPILV